MYHIYRVSASIICYLATTIPCTWITEFHQLHERIRIQQETQRIIYSNRTSPSSTTTVWHKIYKQMNLSKPTISCGRPYFTVSDRSSDGSMCFITEYLNQTTATYRKEFCLESHSSVITRALIGWWGVGLFVESNGLKSGVQRYPSYPW
jgi:hypothetical protein